MAPTIACILMLKNEEVRVTVSLDSAREWVDCFVIFDTGSTDSTKQVVHDYCAKHKIPLHWKDGPFVDFSTSRNVLLDYADDKADYLILLDCNDQIEGGQAMRQFINTYSGPSTAFHLTQAWFNGLSLDQYFNIRLVKSGHNWRYKRRVHEYICCEESESTDPEVQKKNAGLITRVTGFRIFQDRTKDDDKSLKRFARDKELLYQDYKDNCNDARTLFYLAQTYTCMGENEKAYEFYIKRQGQESFIEEKYHALLRCGDLSRSMGHDWEESMTWFIKAYEYSANTFAQARAEPLIKIGEYYSNLKCWELAYFFLKRACELEYPSEAILFVDKRMYDYTRWSALAVVAIKMKQPDIGKNACLKAIVESRQSLGGFITDKKKFKTTLNTIEQGSDSDATNLEKKLEPGIILTIRSYRQDIKTLILYVEPAEKQRLLRSLEELELSVSAPAVQKVDPKVVLKNKLDEKKLKRKKK
jgi:glycosyltransferase involved in cell wall biosynthesis